MIDRRVFLVAAAAAAIGVVPRSAVAADPEAAKAFVRSLANDAIQLMARKDLPRPERTQKFRELFKRGFDVEAIGRFTLGRYWRDATEPEQREYLKLFEDLLVATYAGRFSEYSGETLTVLDSRPEEDRFILVASQINRGGGSPPIRLDWRITENQGNHKIVDVVVEAVSMSVTQRSEFSSVIQRGGGKVQSLIVALRDKTKSLQTR
ncbi:MAG: ABC transporter substrate-binding protein [Alphaproteobacteria bacterium]|nr:ABC transporter substrate-binding protein [Alphaproteobacteria bacterium]